MDDEKFGVMALLSHNLLFLSFYDYKKAHHQNGLFKGTILCHNWAVTFEFYCNFGARNNLQSTEL